MVQRILNVTAISVVALVAVGIGIAVIQSRLQPLPAEPPPRAADFTFKPVPPANADRAATELAGGAIPPSSNPSKAQGKASDDASSAAAETEPPKSYTWQEVEDVLAELREKRTTSPLAWSELNNWYAQLADPSFTKSKDHIEHIKKLQAFQAEFPDSPTPLVVLGRTYINFAWDARGGGFAYTVSDVGRELFQQRAEEAQRLLEQAVSMGVKDGEAYAGLVDTAKAQGASKEDLYALVAAGQKLDPNYYPLYQAAGEFLLPRWYGDPGEVERFANELTTQIPGDDGLVAMGLVVDRIHRYDRGTIFYGEYDRALLGKAGAALARRFPSSRRLMHLAALCTVVAQDHESAQIVLPVVGEFRAEDRVWVWQNSLMNFRQWAEAAEIPGGEEDAFWFSETPCVGTAFAANEQFLWCAAQFGRFPVSLVDLRTKQRRTNLQGPGGVLNLFAFDPDKNWMAAAFFNGDFTGVMVWDVEAEEVIATFPAAVTCHGLAINPVAPQVAWLEGSDLLLADIGSQSEPRRIAVGEVQSQTRYSRNGTRIAVGMRKVFDVAKGELLMTLGSSRDNTPQVLVTNLVAIDEQNRGMVIASKSFERPRYALMRCSEDGTKWDTLIDGFGHEPGVLSPNQRWLARMAPGAKQSNAYQIDIWDIPAAKKVKTLPGHWNPIRDIVFSADSKRLATTGTTGGEIKIWSLADLEEPQPSP